MISQTMVPATFCPLDTFCRSSFWQRGIGGDEKQVRRTMVTGSPFLKWIPRGWRFSRIK